jgi:hypothetical protein
MPAVPVCMVSSHWSNIDPERLGSGQMLSNEDEAISDSNIRLHFCPSSTNLHTNMVSVSIGTHKYAACFYWRPRSSYLCEPAVHI